jgi:hypothetical protein
MLTDFYDYYKDYRDVYAFVEHFPDVGNLLKKAFPKDYDEDPKETINQLCEQGYTDIDIIEHVLDEDKENFWTVKTLEYEDIFEVYRLDKKLLKNYLHKIFDNEYFTEKYFMEIVAEEV